MVDNKEDFSNLKIIDIKIFKFDIPLKDVFQIATMSISNAQNVLIQIQTNEGIDGWGEAASFHALVGETQLINFAAAKELKQLLIGRNPLEISSLVKEMDNFLPHNTTIKSAFDMAIYDIAAKAAGLPLYLYLGGKKREIETDLTIGLYTPEKMVEKALATKAMGFRMIKVKLGLDFEDDLKRLSSIRKAVGDDIILRIDANQGWDRVTAVNSLNVFADLNIEFCEQPCRAYDLLGLKYISHHSKIPVMADESLFSFYDAINLIREDVVPYFNIKFSKSGGIYNAMKIAHIAEAGARPCMIGCMSETKLGITAATHFAMSSDIFRFFDLDSFIDHQENPIIGGVDVKNGILTLPDEPGIGAYPDPDYIKKLDEVK
jgi:L-alanine-DL-glutamate epimerase-like enolase superfamily enzyme